MNEYTTEDVVRTLAVNTMLEAGMPEAAAAIEATPVQDILGVAVLSLDGVDVDDSGYYTARYTYTNFTTPVRIWRLHEYIHVEVLVAPRWGVRQHSTWEKAAQISTKRLPLGAAVEIVEAVFRSQA